jgi:hypothetical protein
MLRNLFRGERPKVEGDDSFTMPDTPATPDSSAGAPVPRGHNLMDGVMGGK